MVAVIALAGSAPASANELRIAGQTQAPNVLYALTTTLAPGGACDLDVQDGFLEFPAPLIVAAGSHEARIVYRRHDRPQRVKVAASRRVDERSKPVGLREILDSNLSRAHAGGKATGWRATVSIKPPAFLTVSTRWAGDRGCGMDDQSVVAYSVVAQR